MFHLQFITSCNMLPKNRLTLFVGFLSPKKVSCCSWYRRCSTRVFSEENEQVYTIGKYFMKLRNPGGFKLPPVVPGKPTDLERAVSLLGHRTQGYLTASRVIELIQLVGAYPLDKETAQRWKGALELYQRKRVQGDVSKEETPPVSVARKYLVYRQGEVVGSVLHTKFMDIIAVPQKDEDVSQVFRILGLFRGRGSLLDEEMKELQQLIGYIPKNRKEAKRVSNALKRLVRARMMYERRPPMTPTDSQTLLHVCDLLHKVEQYGTAGVQGDAYIYEVLQGFPRNENVAKWWYKRLLAVYYTEEGKREAALRRTYLEQGKKEKIERRKENLLSILNKSYQMEKYIKEAGDEYFC